MAAAAASLVRHLTVALNDKAVAEEVLGADPSLSLGSLHSALLVIAGKPDMGAPHGMSSLELQKKSIVSVIKEHKEKFGGKRMFLYVATQAMHTPLPNPGFNLDLYPRTKFSNEFAYANGLITEADHMLNAAVDELKAQSMWDQTLLVHMSDNGATIVPDDSYVRGTNYPLRGGKFTAFEGGVRVPAFIAGGFVPPPMRGTTLKGMVHVSDWYTTFLKLGGLSLHSGQVDGIDVWPYVKGDVPHSPRTGVVLSTYTPYAVGAVDSIDRKSVV